MVFPVALFRGEQSKSEQPSINQLEGHYRRNTKGPPREPLANKEYRKKAISDIINTLNEIRRLEGAIAQEIKAHDTRDQSKEIQEFFVNYQETELEVEKEQSAKREAQAEDYKETKQSTNLVCSNWTLSINDLVKLLTAIYTIMAFILSTRVHHKSAADKTEELDQESAEGLKSSSLAEKHKNTTQAIIHTGEKEAMRRSDKAAEPRWVVERKKVTIREDTIIEAGGTVDVAVNLEKEDKEWDFEINEQYFCNKGLICVKDLDDGMINTMTIMNRNNHGTKILEGSTVGWLYRTDMPLEEVLVLCNVEETEEVTLQDHDIASIKEGSFKKELESLLIEYRDVFSKSTRCMGLTDLTEHIIDVGDAKPIKCRPYKVSQKERAVIDEQINEMLMHNIIRPCTLSSMRHVKNEVDVIKSDTECGLQFNEKEMDFEQGDTIICFETKKVAQKCDWDPGF
ncbi:hypothetical protein JTB14_011449 [Gonioctena quinquepunctata]|nr:hypothetical protein JTB14_011449 [Gonioctena quinquepunctata]